MPATRAELLSGAHLVIDGTDTFDTREAVASACEALGVPLVWGSVQEFDAQVTVFWTRAARRGGAGAPERPVSARQRRRGADLRGGRRARRALPAGRRRCSRPQAIELITGIGEPLLGRVLVIDGLRARQFEVPLRAATATASPTPDAAVTRPAAPTAPPVVAVADLDAHARRRLPRCPRSRRDRRRALPRRPARSRSPRCSPTPPRSQASARSWSCARSACARAARPRRCAAPGSRHPSSPAASKRGDAASTVRV